MMPPPLLKQSEGRAFLSREAWAEPEAKRSQSESGGKRTRWIKSGVQGAELFDKPLHSEESLKARCVSLLQL